MTKTRLEPTEQFYHVYIKYFWWLFLNLFSTDQKETLSDIPMINIVSLLLLSLYVKFFLPEISILKFNTA